MMRTKGSPEELERVRLIAANMFEQNMPTAQIVSLLNVDDQTVRHWRRIWCKAGKKGLAARKPPGGPTKLSDQQKQQLLTMLSQTPEHYGFKAHLWTTKLMAQLIYKTFGVQHHHDHVGAILRKLGWSVQKPARRAKERDETRITAWRKDVWPELEKKVGLAEEHLSLPMKSAF
jgi:transposase